MKKNAVFTICATNYAGLAQVLGRSIFDHYNDLDFYIVLADEPNEEVRGVIESNMLISKETLGYPEKKWNEMSFKYDITEFCTAIKPASFLYFFNKGYEKCVYLDPDILVFDSLERVFSVLNDYSAVVTPHILSMEGSLKESSINPVELLRTGTFNLGFLGVKNSTDTISFLRWWSLELEDKCYQVPTEHVYTDQKWINMLPGFLGNKLYISRNMGLNFAPWNFHERKIVSKNDGLYVEGRDCELQGSDKLIFVHYSGYDYSSLLNGVLENVNSTVRTVYPDIKTLFDVYGEHLKKSNFAKFANSKYSYGFWDNGIKINNQQRKLYRALVENEEYNENPFDKNSYFYKVIKKGVSGDSKNNKSNTNKSKRYKAVKFFNSCLKGVFKILGPSRYYALTQLFHMYGIWENHYFIIARDKDDYKFRM